MSAAAIAMPRFQAATPAMSSLRQGATQAGAAMRQLRQGVQRASGGIGALGTGLRTVGTTLRTLGTDSAGAATSVRRIQRSKAAAGVKRIGDAAARARTAAGRVGSAVGGILALLVPLIPVTDVVTKLMERFGTVMTIASIAMTAVNVAMRANPIGFLVGIIVPIAAYLIELAVNSQTGQKIIHQVFQQALKGFQAVWKFLQPIMRVLGTAVGTYFKGYLTLFTTALKAIGSGISGLSKVGSAVSSASHALRGIASSTMGGIKNAVKPVLSFVTDKIPGFFRTAKDAVSRAMRGIGDLVKGALSAVIGVVKGPINGLIAFANWLIDGLNELSFEIPLTGKKFGVEIDKIPMLADGGIVMPGTADDYRIDSLSQLENRRVPAVDEPPRPPHRVRDFYEQPGAGPRSTAEDLLFLATARQ
ncbi:tape-measure protein [Streptomyces sp. NPDC046237]|uniref:tape-measure protein n=1 Tax=Streptomyces sp. NPDC046237 TaxID=3154914 RepID=UPI0033C5BFB6